MHRVRSVCDFPDFLSAVRIVYDDVEHSTRGTMTLIVAETQGRAEIVALAKDADFSIATRVPWDDTRGNSDHQVQ